MAHGDLLFLGQITGLNDHLEDMMSALFLQCTDLFLHLVKQPVLHIADIHYHIDLVATILQCLAHLGHLGFRHTVS